MRTKLNLSLLGLLHLIQAVVAFSECPDGTTYSPNRHVCLNAVPVPLDYLNAQLSCGLFDARLAKVENQFEQKILLEHLTQKGLQGKLWLGGISVNATWSWYDGKSFGFQNWNENHEMDAEKENCLLLEAESGLWLPSDCQEKAQYICEMDLPFQRSEGCPEEPTCPPCPECPTSTPETCPEITECPTCPTDGTTRSTTVSPPTDKPTTTTATVPLPALVCPFVSATKPIAVKTPSWKYHGLNRYAYIPEARNFFDAEATCVYLGAHLVSVHGKRESAFVASLIPSSDKTSRNLWVGGLSPGNDQFCWTDKTSWNFDELSTANYLERCVQFHYPDPNNRQKHEWNVGDCGTLAGFVCKKGFY
ncbi:hypothetical protein QR680_018624 [Steinernema hermaphroditum]|uniref:C-type lectin domain-containing protein n=1 Tax=Steinernema hermaphroditum TaxID=289476 RepID=A0AA39HIK1_9BILA|nr:hypothetical protein QR680_018624 [Steinernema hermaphroditum]